MKSIDLQLYLKGKGADVSLRPEIKFPEKIIKYYKKPDNFYTLKYRAEPESLDFIYSGNGINDTKFHRILIKEWLYACRPGGHIIIKMRQNFLLSFKELVKEAGITMQDKGKIIETQFNSEKKEGLIIIRKEKKMLEKGDKIGCWSFGIISDGRRRKWVEKEIESIAALKISNYEIIICGAYKGKKYEHIRIIPFAAEDTTKLGANKNAICENARYGNIVVTHDKYIFHKDWYKGMKKYGNYFEVLSCVILEKDGKRSGDWLSYGKKWKNIPDNGKLEYRDWDIHGYIGGGFNILKKSVWRKVKWDDSLGLNDGDDVILSQGFHNKGFVPRFNPYSKCQILLMKRILGGNYKFNERRLGKLINRPLIYRLWYINKVIKRHLFNIDPVAWKIYNYLFKPKNS